MENCGVLSKLFEKGLKSGKELPFIYEEDYISAIKKVLSFRAPYSKVCTVCFSDTAEKFLPELTNAVRSVGAEMISFVTERNYDDELESFSFLFNMPEDVRAMVVFDEELFDKTCYFCSVRNIPIVLSPKDPIGVISVKDSVLLKNGGEFEIFPVSCEKHLIIDRKLYKDGYSSVFGHVISQLVTLADYRITGAIDRTKLNVKGYSLLKEAVISAFNLSGETDEEREINLIFYGILAEAGLNLMGDIRFISAERSSAYLLKKNVNLGIRELFSALSVLDIYRIYTESRTPIFNFLDYNKREKELLRITGFSDGVTLKHLIEQSDFIRKNKITLKAAFLSLKNEIAGFSVLRDKVLKKYRLLGGKAENFGSLGFAVRFSGDLFYKINGMSILREEGFLEESYE